MLAVSNTTESLLYLPLVNEVHSFIRSDVKHSWDCLAGISDDYRCCGNSAAVSRAHLQRHELHSSRLLDYRIMRIKASAAPSHCRNWTVLRKKKCEWGEQVCWKHCSLQYSSLCVSVCRLVTKTVRHPSVTAAARGAKPSWSPAKDKCDQMRERERCQHNCGLTRLTIQVSVQEQETQQLH